MRTTVESWLEPPGIRIAEGSAANLTTAAHVHTAHTDLLRFPGVRWLNLLN